MDLNNFLAFKNQWISLCEEQYRKKNDGAYTVGLEIEFFLLDLEGRPVNLEASQCFMTNLLEYFKSKGGEVNTEKEELGGRKCLSRIKTPTAHNAWNSISYEYPPHMFEASFAFRSNLVDLKTDLEEFFEISKKVALECGCEFKVQPLLDEKQIESMTRLDNDLQYRLRKSRVLALEGGPDESNALLADFPSYLAATHIHIGGHKWWSDPKFVENLYRLEPFIMFEAKGITMKERWDYYFKVFRDFPLVGFPKVESWTIDWWLEELYINSYLPLKEEIKNRFQMNKLRDLQVIRPRAIGTVEFRSDSAQSTVSEIMNLVSMRLGQFLMAKNELPKEIPNYNESCKIWYDQFQSQVQLQKELGDQVYRRFLELVQMREKEEEKYMHFSSFIKGIY